MVPKISTLDSVIYWDATDIRGSPLYCGVAGFGPDDAAYIGKIDKARSTDLRIDRFEAVLSAIPDEEIYPDVAGRNLQIAPRDIASETFIKRPSLHDYYFYRGDDGGGLAQLRHLLLDEVGALEILSKSPHPNIVPYHGCRVKDGRLTGIVLGKVSGYSLWRLLEFQLGFVDIEPFMEALTSAAEYVHKCGLSHNDICPQNVMVSNGEPVLIDFGSCRKTGTRMAASGGSTGWKEDGDDYLLSKESHDYAGLAKIRHWIMEKTTTGIERSMTFAC